MPLRHRPEPGTLLFCDFDTGFRPPEMIKCRPVVVVSPKRTTGPALSTVVPLSTTAPDPVEPFHHLISPESLPGRYARRETWAKCDMVAAVSHERLDRLMVGKGRHGKRRYMNPPITPADWQSIQQALRYALSL